MVVGDVLEMVCFRACGLSDEVVEGWSERDREAFWREMAGCVPLRDEALRELVERWRVESEGGRCNARIRE